ncbi:KxYKxGKxW signal peptide domain-containing protein [Leuconostoc pseudomesenteroides]|uniref:KxYKxGKxW signal peptide domain-containing protein n=1 Tax=Leuconostoc pseudomesenteroides TaxID=33968 RepID=UPI002285C849|nr:KxYKxGKxW signal peptide domain-containing protein [Leuconostoc pseudomesenteroides]WAM38784.1 KxYKxGKxW signal peptide domain-containing protein [Leuconostoc pseudomesenteroides]
MSAKYDGRSSRQTNEVKRYKMYKSGRQWITAGLSTLMVLTGMALIDDTDKVSADTTTGSTAMAASAAANPASAADNTLSNTTSEAVSSANAQVSANSASDSYATGSLGSSAYPTLDSVATDNTVSTDVNDQNAISVDKNADATSNAVDVTTSASATSSSAASTYNNGSVAVTITTPSNATSSLVSPTQSGSTVTTAGGSTATVTSDALATISSAATSANSSAAASVATVASSAAQANSAAASLANSYSAAASTAASLASSGSIAMPLQSAAQAAAISAAQLLAQSAANQELPANPGATSTTGTGIYAGKITTFGYGSENKYSQIQSEYTAFQSMASYANAGNLASAAYYASSAVSVTGASANNYGSLTSLYATISSYASAASSAASAYSVASTAASIQPDVYATNSSAASSAYAQSAATSSAGSAAVSLAQSQATSLADSYAALLNADMVLVNVNYNANATATSSAAASMSSTLTNGIAAVNTDANLKFAATGTVGGTFGFSKAYFSSYATSAAATAAATSDATEKAMWNTVAAFASSLAADSTGTAATAMMAANSSGKIAGIIPALTLGDNNSLLTQLQNDITTLNGILTSDKLSSATYLNPIIDNGDGTLSTNVSVDPNQLIHDNIDVAVANLTSDLTAINTAINTYVNSTIPDFVTAWYATTYTAYNNGTKASMTATAMKLISQAVSLTVNNKVAALSAGYAQTLLNAANAITGTDANSLYAKNILLQLSDAQQSMSDTAASNYNAASAYLGTTDLTSSTFTSQIKTQLGTIGGLFTSIITDLVNTSTTNISNAVNTMMTGVTQSEINLANGINSALVAFQNIAVSPTVTVTAGFDTGTPDVSDVAAGQFATTTYSATYTGALTGTSATVIAYQAIDKTQLQALVNTTTANSNLASVMAAQLTAAQQVLTNDNASQQDLNQAYANLVAQTATITVNDATTGQAVTLTSDSTVYGGSGTTATFDLSKVMPAGYDFSQAVVTGGTIDANGVLTVNFDNDSTVDQPVTIDVPHKITMSSKVNTFKIQLTYEDTSGNILQPATTTTVTGTATLATDGVTGVTTQSGAVVWQGADGVASDDGTTYTVNSIDVPATITSNGQTYYLHTPGEDAQGNAIDGTNAITLTFDENQTVASTQTVNEVYGAAQQVAVKLITVVKASDYTDTVSSSLKEFTDAAGNKYYIVYEAMDGADLTQGDAHIGDTIDPASLQPIIDDYNPEQAVTMGFTAAGYTLGSDMYWDTLGNKSVPGTYTISGAIAEADGSYTHYLIITATPQTTSATVNYVDDETGSVISTATISGQVGSLFDVDGSDTLNGEQQYDTADYQLVSVDNGSGTYVMSAGTDGTSVDATPTITVHLQMSVEKSTSISESESMSTVASLSESTSTLTSESASTSKIASESASTSKIASESTSTLTSESASTSKIATESTSTLTSESASTSKIASESTSTLTSESSSTSKIASESASTSKIASESASTSKIASESTSTRLSESLSTVTSENVSTSEYSELNSTKSSESLSTSSSQANQSQSLSTIASDEISASVSLSTSESTSAIIVSEHNATSAVYVASNDTSISNSQSVNASLSVSEDISASISNNNSASEVIATSVKLSDATSLSDSTAIVNQSDSTSVRVMPSDETSTSESKSQSVSEFTSEFDSTLTSLHQSEVSSERQSKSQVDDATGNIVVKSQATDRVQTLESTTGSNMTAKLTTTASTISAEKVTSANSLSVPSQATVLKGLLPENPKIITARRILIGQYETGDKFNIRLILEILTPLILISGFLLAAKRRKKEDDAETK